MRPCVYCGSTGKRSREHVVSRSVLAVMFGDDIENEARSSLFPTGVLQDFQQEIKDVCTECNPKLSPYDSAGKLTMAAIDRIQDIRGATIPFNREVLGWLVKTHCNIARLDRVLICPGLMRALVEHRELPRARFMLLMRGVITDHEERAGIASGDLVMCNYRRDIISELNVIITSLVLRTVDTFLILPSNADYCGFQARADALIDKGIFETEVPVVDLDAALASGSYTFPS